MNLLSLSQIPAEHCYRCTSLFVQQHKTFPENWDSKAPSVRNFLGLFREFLGMFFFVFQDRELKLLTSVWKNKFVKPHKISTHSAHSDNYYFHFFYWSSDWVEILRCFTKFFFKQALKISVFYLVKQKSFISKNMVSVVVNIKTKKLYLLTQFSAMVLLQAPMAGS